MNRQCARCGEAATVTRKLLGEDVHYCQACGEAIAEAWAKMFAYVRASTEARGRLEDWQARHPVVREVVNREA